MGSRWGRVRMWWERNVVGVALWAIALAFVACVAVGVYSAAHQRLTRTPEEKADAARATITEHEMPHAWCYVSAGGFGGDISCVPKVE